MPLDQQTNTSKMKYSEIKAAIKEIRYRKEYRIPWLDFFVRSYVIWARKEYDLHIEDLDQHITMDINILLKLIQRESTKGGEMK